MKLLTNLILWLTVIAAAILGMIEGWGLEPMNWGVIAATYLWSMLVPFLMNAVNNS